MAKILVLGGNGFIGAHLVLTLHEEGHEVTVLDLGNKRDELIDLEAVKFVKGNYQSSEDLELTLPGKDYVFHLVSTTTPITSESDPFLDVDTNVRPTIRLLELCVEHSIKKLIYPSTGGAIYGDNASGLTDESILPLPSSPYAIGKLTIENYLRFFNKKHGLDYLVYRISNPYGEWQNLKAKQGVIPIFLAKVYRGESLTIFGDGSMIRDYIYVKDVVRAIALSFQKEGRAKVYNLGSGKGHTVNQIVEEINKITGIKVDVKYLPKPSTFVDKVVLDISLFESDFGLLQKTDLNIGLKRTWGYISEVLKNGK